MCFRLSAALMCLVLVLDHGSSYKALVLDLENDFHAFVPVIAWPDVSGFGLSVHLSYSYYNHNILALLILKKMDSPY